MLLRIQSMSCEIQQDCRCKGIVLNALFVFDGSLQCKQALAQGFSGWVDQERFDLKVSILFVAQLKVNGGEISDCPWQGRMKVSKFTYSCKQNIRDIALFATRRSYFSDLK